MSDEGKNLERTYLFGRISVFADGGTTCVPGRLAADCVLFRDIMGPDLNLFHFSNVARSVHFMGSSEVAGAKLPTIMVWTNSSM